MIELLDASRTRPVRCDRADRLRRREAALISTSDGKRIISQLSFSIPTLATIHPESNCYVVGDISRGLSGVQRISRSGVGGHFLSHVWGMRL
jgi:hypothetical protein